MRYSRKERKLPAKSKNVAVLQIKVKTTWLASNSSKPFPVRKKVRTLQFWTKKGKNFHWSEKRLQLAWWSCKQAKTFFAEKKPWQQRNLVTKQQKHSLQWYKVTIMVITCKKTSVWSSASASTWNLFCSWSMKAVFTLKVSQLLHVRVLPAAPTGYGIPQLQLQCGVVVTSCSSSSSHSDVWQWSPPYPVDDQVVNLVLVSSIERVLGQLVDVSVWKERPSNDKIKGGLDVQ